MLWRAEAEMAAEGRGLLEGFASELEKIADGRVPLQTPGAPPPAPSPVRTAPYMASEHAEHMTDLGGLGVMGLASADELGEALTGKSHMGSTGRDLANLAGLGLMAAPSWAASKHLARRGSGTGVAGGGSKYTNAVNLFGLGALGIPIIDRLQAKMRGRPEEGRFLNDRQSALMELAGYGGLASNLVRSKMSLPKTDAMEHQLLNRQLMGYGILAAPELEHAMANEHPEHPNFDAQGNETPQRPSMLRPITDMVGLSLLGQPVLSHLHHA